MTRVQPSVDTSELREVRLDNQFVSQVQPAWAGTSKEKLCKTKSRDFRMARTLRQTWISQLLNTYLNRGHWTPSSHFPWHGTDNPSPHTPRGIRRQAKPRNALQYPLTYNSKELLTTSDLSEYKLWQSSVKHYGFPNYFDSSLTTSFPLHNHVQSGQTYQLFLSIVSCILPFSSATTIITLVCHVIALRIKTNRLPSLVPGL